MVLLDPDGVEIVWTQGSKKGLKVKVSKADADKLVNTGWAKVKAPDAPPKDKAIKSPVKKK